MLVLIVGMVLAKGGQTSQVKLPRETILFDSDWRFKKGDAPGSKLPETEVWKWQLPTSNEFIADPAKRYSLATGDLDSNLPYIKPDYDDSSWRRLDLPHDWGIEGQFSKEGGGGTGRLPFYGVGWYRKSFEAPASDQDRCLYLDFDGAMSNAVVWLNGHFIGGWPYGYASWRVPLTSYLRPGERNVVSVRLDNPSNSSRWYPGGGIYRHVWLVKTSLIHVDHWGTSVTTPEISAKEAKVVIQIALKNEGPATPVEVTSEIYRLDGDGKAEGRPVARTPAVSVSVGEHGDQRLQQQVSVLSPRLWGPSPTQKPNRYVAITTVAAHGQVLDRYETPFGIRTIQFTPDRGMLVNGQRVDIKGVCDHHDLGALGAALNERALHRQIDTLIEMGANAIRTSHNPPAPELLDYADEKGLLILDEYVDVWQAQKTPNDYHRIFDDWHEQDLRAMIRRDRNHPSVIAWSVGNEVGEQFRGEAGAKVAQMLTDIAHDADPTRPTTSAMNAAQASGPFPAAVDLIGLNYQGTGVRSGPPQYPVFHRQYPDKFIFGSETTSTISSRGEYYFPVTSGHGVPASANAGEDPDRHQVSSYDLYSAPWSYSPDMEFRSQEMWPFVGGEFVWTGWDYLGEPTPFDSSRSSYFGIVDLAGFKKDRFYLYQAHWRPDLPMAHILPHWSWPERIGLKDAEGKPVPTPVHVYTSGDEGELFLNGKSLGIRKKGKYEYRLRWDDVVYKPGTLKVVTYKNGQPWATDEIGTTGPASRLELKPDRTRIAADGKDLSFISVAVQDSRGRTVPRSHPRLRFTIAGPGEIVGTDNGDPTDMEALTAHDRDAFNGLALVIVRSRRGEIGKIQVTATADGLRVGRTAVETLTHKANR